MTGSPRGDVLRGWLLGLLAYFVSSGTVTTSDLELSGLSIELQCEKVNYPAFHSWFARMCGSFSEKGSEWLRTEAGQDVAHESSHEAFLAYMKDP